MLPFELCTTLRNGTAARLKQVSLPHSKQNRSILGLLLKHGFVSSVNYGDESMSDPAAFQKASTSSKRIWAGLKYRNDRPILGDIQLISKPSKRVIISHEELIRLLSGRRAQFIKPVGLGEIALLKTAQGWMDGREAVSKGLGGELTVRAMQIDLRA